MEEKLGQEPAFACATENGYQAGISKRFYAACAAMNGLLSDPSITKPRIGNKEEHIAFANVCFQYADALLKQENQTEQ